MRTTILACIAAAVLAGAAAYFIGFGRDAPLRSLPLSSEEGENEHAVLPGAGGVKEAAKAALPGTWRSLEDAGFTREFKADGSWVDRYDDTPPTAIGGAWTLFTSEEPAADFPGSLEAGAAYLRMKTQEEEGADLFFKILKISPESLELMFLDRGGMLTFQRA